MKYALVVENDGKSSERISGLLKWLGYVTALVKTPLQALNVVSSLKFNVIVTCVCRTKDDRRALTGELKRAVPDAAVILLTDEHEKATVSLADCPGVSAVMAHPPSLDSLRRTLEFGIDGDGTQFTYSLPFRERRRRRF